MNAPENYTDDMLKGIYAAHPDMVKYVNDDLRCYCTAQKKDGKVAIITGGGTGHLPLFLGYVGENLLDGCGVGSVFQSPSSEQIYNISKEVEAGAGILYLYGNYTGDIMNFDMAAEMLEMDDIETRSIVGADDVLSNANSEARRGVAGIFFMYKCAGAKAAEMGTLDEVLASSAESEGQYPSGGLRTDSLRDTGNRTLQFHAGRGRNGIWHGNPRGAWCLERAHQDIQRTGRGSYERNSRRYACGRGRGSLHSDQRLGGHKPGGTLYPVGRCDRNIEGERHKCLPHICG